MARAIRIPYLRYMYRKKFTTLRLQRYDLSNLRRKDFRLAAAIQNALKSEVEVERRVGYNTYDNNSSPASSQETEITVDGRPVIISSREQLIGKITLHEYSWYGVVVHQLVDLFEHDFNLVVTPQHHLRNREFNLNTRRDDISYCIPDFCVTRLMARKTPTTLEIEDARILLIVESKSSGDGRAGMNRNLRDAWRQVLEQAGILFSQRKDQQYVGVMVTVGTFWLFRILSRDDATYANGDDQEYTPSGSTIEILKKIKSSSQNRLPNHCECPSASSLLQFGTVVSDKELMTVRKKLLRLFPNPQHPRRSRR